ncbi:DUF5723 family protein [Winogradskyella thalassocola]|uniref:DUF5723 domain-containing protein n=1 Tax=Winogradskyella thalassocola TaxID=262004 RepID=A0A1G8EZ19_9FLAO|nr:DUF5723 family protein [Winogradskyella thalassocola]SDH75148.1 hypothetical protein SAMN04489796_10486 [Winogradskyella thalassocola]
MKNTKLFNLFIFLLTLNLSFGQSYVGHSIDNYSGIHGVVYNPSSIVGSNLRADINLFSASLFGGSDYFGINVSDILNSDGGFDFEDDAKKFPSNTNNFFVNVDVVGPSFMFNLNKKSSIGVISRVRANMNINNINGELYETISNDFDSDDDFDFDSKDLTGTIHAWAEVGLAYGRILIEKPNHLLKGGVTLKYLQGAGSAFMSSPELQGFYSESAETLTTQGNLIYGTSQDFESDDLDFSNLTAGFGLDVGFTYQWYSNRENDSLPTYKTPYKLKVGVSVTDIGSINYDNSTVNNYDLNATVDTSDSEDDTEDFLEDNYNGVETIEEAKIKLPTALHLLVDYRLAKKWFVSAQANLSMVKKGSEMSTSIINTVTVAPRLETKWFSFYAPLSFRQYGDTSFGGGIRVGPLTVGSGSVFTNLLSDSSKTTDVYLGLNIPLYR